MYLISIEQSYVITATITSKFPLHFISFLLLSLCKYTHTNIINFILHVQYYHYMYVYMYNLYT